MKKWSIILLFVACASMLQAQESATIMTVDGDKISSSEFKSIYKKNNKDADFSKEALDEYVELFINFKLKVKEAERLKLDSAADFQKELAGYRRQLSRPYLVDSEMTDQLLREAYNRLGQEVKASHILIMVGPDDSPQDTLVAYNKIKAIKEEVKKGKISFANAALRSSEDPSAKQNKGQLGYFTSLQMVYPFESAAYNTAVGEVSNIIRTQYGYHILWVHDKRDARGELRAAHIMIKSTDADSPEVQAKAEQKINDLYKEIVAGADFAQLAIQHSADKSSSRNGGELPWFGSNDMVEQFENAAFALTADNEVSEPVKSRYGWHVIKRLESRGLPSYEEKEKELKQRISKDVRSQLSTRSFTNRIKKEYGFKEKRKRLVAVHAVADSSILGGSWRPKGAESMSGWLFKIGKTKYTQGDFVKYLRATQGRSRETNVRKYVDDKYDLFMTKSLLDYEDARLENKHPEFKALMKEYRDGILLFELTDQKVWSKAVQDTLGLKKYYDANMDDFMFENRAVGTIYRAKDLVTAERVRAMVSEGTTDELIEKEINKESQLDLTIMSGKYEKNNKELTKVVPFEVGVSEIKPIDGIYAFIQIDEVLSPSHKPFDKVKGLVTAGYQTELEKAWIEELRARYTVVLNRDVLYSLK